MNKDPVRFEFGNVVLKSMMIECNDNVHFGFRAADFLVTDVELLVGMPALDERRIFAIAKHAVAAALECFCHNFPNRIDSLSGGADDFQRDTGQMSMEYSV